MLGINLAIPDDAAAAYAKPDILAVDKAAAIQCI
jgi:hypothetical protein